MITRQHIEVTAKIYKCHDAAKKLLGAEFKNKIQVYKNLVLAHQKKFNIDTLPATLELCSLQCVKDSGIAVMYFMAAAVEIIENNKTK